ncbi:GDP/GTP exchange factor Sec2p [Ancylostoma duodenale]|uniref:GDP/GTP exchange factor Sec2p n=1 Tax=Ancylostoma duodenale TaxID=51022 RepID=A0A0C2HAM0_9BILA|nr:GDP/GTP exchange factor Sec2p [Ancylostoma duodenale]
MLPAWRRDYANATRTGVSSYPVLKIDLLIFYHEHLRAARRSIAEKDEKMCRMSRIQDSVDAEVQELTEKLFQEAYRMVNYAEERRERAEKLLNESRLQVEVLSAEVAALKVLVQTPGMGHNHFLHTSPEHKSALAKLFSTSSSAKRSSSSGAVLPRKSSTMPPLSAHQSRERERESEQRQADSVEEVDPILMAEFTSWREAGHPFVHHPFMDRINTEEISPCMLFHAKEVHFKLLSHATHAEIKRVKRMWCLLQLSDAILDSIAANKLELEPVHEDKPTVIPCALTNVSRFCPYRVRVSEDAEWHRISLLARNRIAAVCDYYTFIRYLRQGLIKAGVRDTYFDVMTLRKNMCLAKLGLGFVPKTNLRPGF